jgi:hypothetical protein
MRANSRGKKAELVLLEPGERITGPKVGRISSADEGQPVRVEIPGRAAAVEARVAAAIEGTALARAVKEGQEALLVFEDGRPDRPIVVALLASSTPHLDAVLASPTTAAKHLDARVDGRRVVVEGRSEIALRCGKASLVMTEDGTVTLRGFKIVTQAESVQKIRGRRVHIN